jgi:pyruvate carboxylase
VQVFTEWMAFVTTYGDVSVLPTKYFTTPLAIGEEIAFEIEKGKTLYIRLKAIGTVDATGHRDVMWEFNGEARTIRTPDKAAGVTVKQRVKADKSAIGQVGAPMPGVVVDVRAKPGQRVDKGAPLVVLSAMKMETVVAAPMAGIVAAVPVAHGDNCEPGDLLFTIAAPAPAEAATVTPAGGQGVQQPQAKMSAHA